MSTDLLGLIFIVSILFIIYTFNCYGKENKK